MTPTYVFGLFRELMSAAETVDRLRELGVPDGRIEVLSGVPLQAEMLGRPRPRRRIGRIAILGALLGVLTGLFLSAGIFLLYPLEQGGQPLIPIPPSLIILFEVTMLGTMWATFLGLLLLNRFPAFGSRPYDPRISEGFIGVLAEVADDLADDVERAFGDYGAEDVRREAVGLPNKTPYRLFWGGVAALLVVSTALLMLAVYDIIPIPFPSQMVNQPSLAYVQGPRLAAPADAIPVQGPSLIAGEPATLPRPASSGSLQRGKVLFSITCSVCHGEKGDGDSALAEYFSPRPADLTGETVQGFEKSDLFLVMTEGRGAMPSMAENLSVPDRWDVANYVSNLAP